MIGGQLAEVRSITEIYRSAEMRTAIGDDIRKSVDDGTVVKIAVFFFFFLFKF